MRAKHSEREQAIALRQKGLSYREIRSCVPVSKSSLSLWLREVGLARRQIQRLTDKKLAAGRRGGQIVHEMRMRRLADRLRSADQEAKSLLAEGDLWWAVGVVLYWAEGGKMKEWSTHNRFEFTNMDPVMITFMRVWLRRYCGVHDQDIRFRLGIHQNADVRGSLQFWARHLGVAPTEIATWLKRHNPSPKRRNTGSTYHGTIRMEVVRSTALSHRIAGWIQSMRVHCGVV
jgi:hypothetical protein